MVCEELTSGVANLLWLPLCHGIKLLTGFFPTHTPYVKERLRFYLLIESKLSAVYINPCKVYTRQ